MVYHHEKGIEKHFAQNLSFWDGRALINKRTVRSVVKHLSANPKVPGSILGPVSYRVHGL